MPQIAQVFLAVPILIFGLLGSALAQKSPVPIVDVHVHIMPDRTNNFENSINKALALMNRFGVVRAVAMSPPRVASVRLNFEYPDFKAILARYADRFSFLAGGGSLNHTIHAIQPDAVSEQEKQNFTRIAHKAISDGASGFGEIGSLHISLTRRHKYSYAPSDHPLLLRLADIAAERDVPIDLHMDAVSVDMETPSQLAQYPNNPSRLPATLGGLERLLKHNREARIVWAHGGSDHLGEMTPDRINDLMDRHSNLYVSLRVVGPMAPLKNKLFSGPPPRMNPDWSNVLRRHSDRFVIGAEGFYGGPIAQFAATTERRLKATVRFLSLLPRDLARKIAAENAIRIYRLPPLEERASQAPPAPAPAATGPLCMHGNMEHCRVMCERGRQPACMRLKRGF
jgi:hypothetical protein